MQLRLEITPITAAERTRSSGPNGSMNQREDYQEAKRMKERLYQESGKADARLHPSEQVRQRPGQPFTWHDEGSERVDPKDGLKVVQLEPHQPGLLPRDGNRLRGGNLLHGHRHQDGVNDSFFQTKPRVKEGNGDSLGSDGVCKDCTKPTHTSHCRSRDFSRLAEDLSHQVRNRCVSQTVILHL